MSWDANGNTVIDGSLEDFDDWSNIKFLGGAIGDVGDGDLDLPMVSPPEPAVTTDFVPPTTSGDVDPRVTELGSDLASDIAAVVGNRHRGRVSMGSAGQERRIASLTVLDMIGKAC